MLINVCACARERVRARVCMCVRVHVRVCACVCGMWHWQAHAHVMLVGVTEQACVQEASRLGRSRAGMGTKSEFGTLLNLDIDGVLGVHITQRFH